MSKGKIQQILPEKYELLKKLDIDCKKKKNLKLNFLNDEF